MKKISKILAIFVIVSMMLVLAGCAGTASVTTTTEDESIKIGSLADLDGKIIGVQMGTTGDILASDEVKAKSVERYTQYVDVITSLKQKKVDCVIMDRDTANAFLKTNTDLVSLDVGFEPEQYAVAVKKGDSALQAVVNEVIAAMKADGSLTASFKAHEDQKGAAPDLNTSAKGGDLIVGTNAGFPPYEYMNGDTAVGVDMDIMAQVAKKLDKKLVIENMAFDGLITALVSGKINAIAAGMTASDERKVNVDFSDIYVDALQVVVIRAGSKK